MTPSPDRRPVGSLIAIAAVIGAVSIACHAAYFLRFGDHYVRDSASYITPAESFVRGDGFLNATGAADTRRTPGYPLLIAPFLWLDVDLKYLVVVQHAAAVVLAVGVALFTFRLTGRGVDAIVAGVAASVDPAILNAANTILTETTFACALSVVCYALWALVVHDKGPRAAAAVGLMAGASVLIRPIALLFVVPAALFILLGRQRRAVAGAVSFALAFSLVPILWSARTYRETGYFSVSSIAALTILLRGAGTLAVDDPGDFNTNFLARRHQLEREACEDILRVEGQPCERVLVATRADYQARRARAVIRERPLAYARVMLRGIANTLLGGDAVHLVDVFGRWTTPVLLTMGVAASTLASVGLLHAWRSQRAFCYLAFLTIGYFLAVSAGPETYSRHRVPMLPLYAMLIGMGAGALLRCVWQTRRTAATLGAT